MPSRKGWHFFMEEVKICSFFGHRTITITQEFYATVKTEVMQSVDFGCRVFYFGGFGEFDALCYEIVTAIQKEKPELGLKRVYCVPLERGLTKRGKYPQEPYE